MKTEILDLDLYVYEFSDAVVWEANRERGEKLTPSIINDLKNRYPNGFQLKGWNSNGILRIDVGPELTRKVKVETLDSDETLESLKSRGVSGNYILEGIENAVKRGWLENNDVVKKISKQLGELGSAWPDDELQDDICIYLYDHLTPLQLKIFDSDLSCVE